MSFFGMVSLHDGEIQHIYLVCSTVSELNGMFGSRSPDQQNALTNSLAMPTGDVAMFGLR